MKIRTKTLIALGILFAVLFGLIVSVSVFLYMGELHTLEYQQTQKDVTRVQNHLKNEMGDLSGTLHDWAYWDESYAFAADRNPSYIERNVNTASLSAIRINLLLILDNNGNILYGTVVDPRTGETVPLPPGYFRTLPSASAFFNHTSLRSTNTGYLLLPDGPVFLASTPILSSGESGPARGVMVMGRALDAGAFARINRVTGTNVSIRWDNSTLLTPDEKQLLGTLAPGTGFAMIPLGPNRVAGYNVLEDINGKRILLEVDQPRDLFTQGVSLIIAYLVLFAIIFIAAAVLVISFMDRVVLRRVDFLTRRVESLGKGTGPLPEPELAGNDEIAMLEREILSSNKNLAASEHTLRTFIDAVTDPALMLRPDGTILLANAAIARRFRLPVRALTGKKIQDCLRQKDIDRHREQYSEAVREKKIVQYETDTGERQYYVSIYPVLDGKGEIDKVAVVTLDITERNQAENALALAKKKLSLLNTVIFTDLQNQIFVLLAYISLARSSKRPLDPAEFLGKESAAVKAIQTQLSFLQKYQMLGLNPPRWRDLTEVILFAESHLDMSPVVVEKPPRGLEIYADPLIENVFFNLFENSILHGDHVSVIRIRFAQEEDDLVLTVEDDGAGVPESHKEEIFEKGTGTRGHVGLFLSREILGITGITIRETGIYGTGARFELRIPKGMYRFP